MAEGGEREMAKCAPGCTCGRHGYYGGATSCPPGCTCGRHVNRVTPEIAAKISAALAGNKNSLGTKCAEGCTCGKHKPRARTAAQLAKCEVGCTCGRHPDGKLPPDDPKRRRTKTPGVGRRDWLKYAHKMSLADWDAMWTDQAGRCCYCQDPLSTTNSKQIHIDHDHSCCPPGRSCAKCRRGLSCQKCNIIVGNALEDPERLEIIARNLQRLKDAALERLNAEVTAMT